MKLIRYKDSGGNVGYAAQQPSGTVKKIVGDIFGRYDITDTLAEVIQLLCPIAPPLMFCIGRNYRRHAEESGYPIPDFPIVCMKNPAAIQHPVGPVEIPMHLPSTQVDYECELAVVIGKRCKNANRS